MAILDRDFDTDSRQKWTHLTSKDNLTRGGHTRNLLWKTNSLSLWILRWPISMMTRAPNKVVATPVQTPVQFWKKSCAGIRLFFYDSGCCKLKNVMWMPQMIFMERLSIRSGICNKKEKGSDSSPRDKILLEQWLAERTAWKLRHNSGIKEESD